MVEEIDQYMTLKLGNEQFAVNVAHVREVLEVSTITRIPTSPDYLRGVVNVRGTAVPVVDLRLRFGLAMAPDTVNTRIVVLDLLIDGESTVLGGVADSVHEVIELDASQINPAPRIAMRWRTEFIKGMARVGDDFIIVLDVNAVFGSDELVLLNQVAAEEPETIVA